MVYNNSKRTILYILTLFALPFVSKAGTFVAQSDGDWSVPGTWGHAVLTPTSGDDVIIDGYQITLSSGTINANSISLTNSTGTGTTSLTIQGSGVLNVTNDIDIDAENMASDVTLIVKGDGIINVGGNMIIDRVAGNNQTNLLQLLMYNDSKLFVSGAFTFNYNASGNETDFEVYLYDQALLEVSGITTFNVSGGVDFSFVATGQADIDLKNDFTVNATGGTESNISIGASSNLTVTSAMSLINSGATSGLTLSVNSGADAIIGGNFTMNSSSATEPIAVNITGSGSTLDLNGNLGIVANANSSAVIDLSTSAIVYLAGEVSRTYGHLNMDNTAAFHFDGTGAQNLPVSDLGVGGDSFIFSNLIIANTSDAGASLLGDLIVSSDMTFTDGIIHTTSARMLIIDDGASVGQGNSGSYVDGPMMKRGATGGTPFEFPVGDNGIFAPVDIQAISSKTLEVTVEYLGCPPPVGSMNAPLQHINQRGYWTLNRSDGDAIGDITLRWDDADKVGLSDISSLTVAYYNGVSGWHSLGRSNETGNVGAAQSGSITNDLGCPPPVGGSIFTIGSTDADENVLPVELGGFRAYKNEANTKVYLEWETLSEINSAFFVIEKSNNGEEWHMLEKIEAAQNSTTIQYYSAVDNAPSKGNNYYRIVEVDQNEIMNFSRLVNIFIKDQEDQPTIYPNPVQDHLRLYSKSLSGQEVNIKIYNLNGQCVYNHPHETDAGHLLLMTSAINIRQAGTYFLTYEHQGEIYSMKFMKVD